MRRCVFEQLWLVFFVFDLHSLSRDWRKCLLCGRRCCDDCFLLQRLRHGTARHGHFRVHVNRINSCCDNAHAHHATHFGVQSGTNDDVGIRVDFFANAVGRFVQFEQGQVVTAGDVDQNTLRAAQADFVQQRVCDGFFCGLDRAIFALGLACAHHGFAHFVHYGANVSKVEVDQAGTNHQIGHALNTLVQNIIRHGECFGECGFLVRQTEQVLVRNDDQRIDDLLQGFNTLLGLTHTLVAFELERLGHDAYGQNTQFTCSLCDDRCSTCPGAPAHTSRDETHVRTGKVINDLLNALFGGGSPDRGPRACAQTFGDFHAKLDAAFGLGLLQRLRIGVCHHEFNTIEVLLDHVVHGVTACPADTENGNPGLEVALSWHGKVKCHEPSACIVLPACGAFFRSVNTILQRIDWCVT